MISPIINRQTSQTYLRDLKDAVNMQKFRFFWIKKTSCFQSHFPSKNTTENFYELLVKQGGIGAPD